MTHVEQEICETSRHTNLTSSAGSECRIPEIRMQIPELSLCPNARAAASRDFLSIASCVWPCWLLHTEPTGQPVQEILAVCSHTGCEAMPRPH